MFFICFENLIFWGLFDFQTSLFDVRAVPSEVFHCLSVFVLNVCHCGLYSWCVFAVCFHGLCLWFMFAVCFHGLCLNVRGCHFSLCSNNNLYFVV